MSEASPPSMLPNAPREPAYVARLRGRLSTETLYSARISDATLHSPWVMAR